MLYKPITQHAAFDPFDWKMSIAPMPLEKQTRIALQTDGHRVAMAQLGWPIVDA